jgi:hypothetical protein
MLRGFNAVNLALSLPFRYPVKTGFLNYLEKNHGKKGAGSCD